MGFHAELELAAARAKLDEIAEIVERAVQYGPVSTRHLPIVHSIWDVLNSDKPIEYAVVDGLSAVPCNNGDAKGGDR